MRTRSNTEFDTRRRLVTLATCLPSQNELAFDRQRTSYVSWIKRYYFFSLPFSFFVSLPYRITISLEIILLSLYLFVDIRIIIIIKRRRRRRKKRKKNKRHFYYFLFSSRLDEIFFLSVFFLLLVFLSKSLVIPLFPFGYTNAS